MRKLLKNLVKYMWTCTASIPALSLLQWEYEIKNSIEYVNLIKDGTLILSLRREQLEAAMRILNSRYPKEKVNNEVINL